MAEGEAAHRRSIEKKSLEASIGDTKSQRTETRIGQVFGLVIGLSGLAVSLVAAAWGQQWFASVVGGGTILGLVSVFVTGRRTKSDQKHSDSGETDRAE